MKHTALFLAMIGLVAAAVVAEDNFDQFNVPPKEPEARPSENIALGVSYAFSASPNYGYCTDPEDPKQLTDGVYSEGYFWVQKSTVGWQNKCPVVITFDLGEDKPIRGASFHTAAGRAGVAWPQGIFIFVAGEDKQFYELGNLVGLSAEHGLPPADEYGTHRYWTDELRTHGRYVAFVVSARPYAFVDEIEVYAGEADWLELPHEGEPTADIQAHVASLQVREAIMQRLRTDIAAVRYKAEEAAISDDERKGIFAELDAIRASLDDLPVDYGDDFRAVLPVNPLHERLFKAQADLWACQGYAPMTVWQSGLWDPISPVGDVPKPGGAPRDTAIGVYMMRNEHRAGSFNITNATQEPTTVEVRIAGLPGGTNPSYVTVHEVVWTDTSLAQPVAAALPEAPREGDAYVIGVTPGLTRQVWLTFHPVDVEPGVHEGRVQVKWKDETVEVPLALYLFPMRFPDNPTLHFGGWDYVNSGGHRGVTLENRDAFIAHLREHYVDSPWATSGVIPKGQHDATGAMTAEPGTADFDEWLELWPNAGQYCIFASVASRFLSSEGRSPGEGEPSRDWPMGTAEFETAVKDWAAFWANHAKEKGIDPGQVLLLLVDEPHSAKQDEIILAWAKAIRAADTGLKIWEDPVYKDMGQANPEMVAACHVLCPNRGIFLNADQAYRDFFAEQRKQGIALEFYSCSGPARLLDPYGYYRLQAWTCWKEGARATYFWAFGDNSGVSSWNEYRLTRSAYTPFFLDNTSVTPGKQMEACREGIEDYEYLVMLRDAIKAAEANGVSGEALDQAKKLLAELPEHVLEAGTRESFHWSEKIDRTVADDARLQILNALVALQQASGPQSQPDN